MSAMLQRIRSGFRKFMTGRRGPDELSLTLLISGLVLTLMSNILRLTVLYYVGLVCYVFSLFRMLSRDQQRRYIENAKFLSIWHDSKTSVIHFFNRLKNSRKYKYYKCPQCHSWLRLPRRVGEVTVTCGKCSHVFKQKA